MEVGQADDGHERARLAAAQQIQPHHALRMLRLRGRPACTRASAPGRWCEPARARRWANPAAAGEERRPHVDVGRQVLHVGHIAMLAEEGRAGDQRAGRGRVELVGRVGEDDEVAGAGRVRHVGGAARPVGDVARLGLGVGPVDHLPAFRLAVAGPVVGIAQARKAALIWATVRLHRSRGTCVKPPPAGSRPARFR